MHILSFALTATIWGCIPKKEVKTASIPPFDGFYPTQPLEKDVVRLSVIQSGARLIEDAEQAPTIMAENLRHIVEMGKKACLQKNKPDILLFHEFPLTGYFYGDRDAKQHIAITIPGPETEALGLLAKKCDAYIVFGAYAKDSQWPGHIMSINTIIDRSGKVRKKVWKPRNIKQFVSTAMFSSSVANIVTVIEFDFRIKVKFKCKLNKVSG